MSATISNASRRSLRGKILAKAQAKVEAKAKATTPARASRKDVVKDKTRVKVDEEEALTASPTTRTRTRTEATPTLIQGGTPSPPEGSLVLPHAHKRDGSNHSTMQHAPTVLINGRPKANRRATHHGPLSPEAVGTAPL